jgi:hypothetical protein
MLAVALASRRELAAASNCSFGTGLALPGFFPPTFTTPALAFSRTLPVFCAAASLFFARVTAAFCALSES